jgi:uncharacterized membrane protein
VSIDRAENDVAATELDLQHLLRPKKVKPLHETKNAMSNFSSEAFQISGRSIQEIDHLIEGLRAVRQKLTVDRDQLQLEMARHAEFSETVLEVTKIISESMAHVK